MGVAAFNYAYINSLLRTNEVAIRARAGLAELVASQPPQSGPLSMGGFDADPGADQTTRLATKRLFTDAFDSSDARTEYLEQELGRVVRWPEPGQTPSQLREAQMGRERLTRLLEVEQTKWTALRENANTYVQRLGSLINQTFVNSGAFYAEIVRDRF